MSAVLIDRTPVSIGADGGEIYSDVKLANVLRNFHRNSCHPEATDAEVKAAIDAIRRVQEPPEEYAEVVVEMRRVLATIVETDDAAMAELRAMGLDPDPQTAVLTERARAVLARITIPETSDAG